MSEDYQRYNTRSSKLTRAEVQEIRRLYYEERWSQPRLARKFNMSGVQIGRIVRGESQRSVPETVDTSAADIDPNGSPPDPDELAASMARLSEKLNPTSPAPAEPAAPDHAAAIADLAKQVRERKGLDNAAEAAREETRDDSKDTVQTAGTGPEANPADAASSVRDRDAGSSAGEGGAAAAGGAPPKGA